MYFLHAVNSDRQKRLLNVLGYIAMILGGKKKQSCLDIIVMDDSDKIFLTELPWKMRLSVLPMTPKQSDRVLNGLVRLCRGRRN